MGDFFIILPVHNRLALTHACLDSLAAQDAADVTIVVVDDGSTDGTAEAIREEHPEVRLLFGDGDCWWTGAVNIGLRWVLEQSSPDDVVVTLNDDAIAPPDYLRRLARAHRACPDCLIGSLLLNEHDRSAVVDGGVRVHWPTARYTSDMRDHHGSPPDPDAPDLYPVDVLGGCGTLIPVSVFRKVGAYDDRALRHYGADYELSRRASRAGFRLLVDKRSALYVRTRESGLHVTAPDSDIRALLRSFWHLKSANDLRLRWRFARRVCPPRWLPLYVPSDYARVVLGSTRRWLTRGAGG